MARTGRPTDNPKPHKISIRLDDTTKKILDEYCVQESVPVNEAARRGISMLENKIKK